MQLIGGEALVVDIDRAVDGDVAGRAAQAGDLGVVAHLEGQRVRGRAVGARLEQQRVPLGAELVGDLLVGDRVHGGLDLALRHARSEHVDVRAEGRAHRPGARRGRRWPGRPVRRSAWGRPRPGRRTSPPPRAAPPSVLRRGARDWWSVGVSGSSRSVSASSTAAAVLRPTASLRGDGAPRSGLVFLRLLNKALKQGGGAGLSGRASRRGEGQRPGPRGGHRRTRVLHPGEARPCQPRLRAWAGKIAWQLGWPVRHHAGTGMPACARAPPTSMVRSRARSRRRWPG